jgi:hypothetical protein
LIILSKTLLVIPDNLVDVDGSEDTSEEEYNFNKLSGFHLQDDDKEDWSPQEEATVVYSSQIADEWDEDETPYDFLRMAAEYTEAEDGQHGGLYVIGLAPKPNQLPVGWANSTMIAAVDPDTETFV